VRVVRNPAEDADEAAHHRRLAARQPGDVWLLYEAVPYTPSIHLVAFVLKLGSDLLNVNILERLPVGDSSRITQTSTNDPFFRPFPG